MSVVDQGNTEIDPDVLNELTEAFSLFDKNNSQTITPTDLGVVMRSLGSDPSEAELRQLIAGIDGTGKGAVDFPEFLQTMLASAPTEEQREEQVLEAFQIFDQECKGDIDASQLKSVMTRLGENLTDQELDLMVAAAGRGTGKITLEQFKVMWTEGIGGAESRDP